MNALCCVLKNFPFNVIYILEQPMNELRMRNSLSSVKGLHVCCTRLVISLPFAWKSVNRKHALLLNFTYFGVFMNKDFSVFFTRKWNSFFIESIENQNWRGFNNFIFQTKPMRIPFKCYQQRSWYCNQYLIVQWQGGHWIQAKQVILTWD